MPAAPGSPAPPSPSLLPGPVVAPEWLADHLDDVVVVEVRWYPDGRSTRAAFEEGHLPGAVPLDLDEDLSAPASVAGGRHPLPDPAAFAATLGRLGIGPTDPVVAYDDARGSIAARLWWMLRVLGRPAAVLDGGIDAWAATFPDRVVTGPPPDRAPVVVPVVDWPSDRFVDADVLDRLRVDPSVLLVDARAAERYAGGPSPLDPRPGHIPGAVSAPWMANVDPVTGRLLPAEVLRERFDALGAGTRSVVASCGSGVTACHDLLALAVAGLLDGPSSAGTSGEGGPADGVGVARLFVGSWSAWGADPARPAASGPDPFGTDVPGPFGTDVPGPGVDR